MGVSLGSRPLFSVQWSVLICNQPWPITAVFRYSANSDLQTSCWNLADSLLPSKTKHQNITLTPCKILQNEQIWSLDDMYQLYYHFGINNLRISEFWFWLTEVKTQIGGWRLKVRVRSLPKTAVSNVLMWSWKRKSLTGSAAKKKIWPFQRELKVTSCRFRQRIVFSTGKAMAKWIY